jgi:hypothetical protein
LRGREGFGVPLSLPPRKLGGIHRFRGSEMHIFYYARGKVSEAKGPSDVAPDAGSGVTGRIRWLTLGAAQLGGCTGMSDGLTSDAG